MSGLRCNTPQGAFAASVKSDTPLTPKHLAERLGIRDIECPADGWRLRVPAGGVKIDLPQPDGTMTVTVQYVVFRRPPAPTLNPLPSGFGPMLDKAKAAPRDGVQPHWLLLSNWIDGSVKPTMVGWYERNYTPWLKDETVLYAFWNGAAWGTSRLKPGDWPEGFQASRTDDIPWRGLRHDPTRGTGA